MKKTYTSLATASIVLLCVIALMPSCKKDANGTTTSSSAAILTKAVWTFQKFEYQKPDGSWIPDPDAVDANRFTVDFNSNGTYTEIDLNNGTTATAQWNFSSNNTVLTLGGGYNTDAANYSVSLLNSTTLILIEPKHPAQATGYTAVRWTFTR